jgi:polysaccharide transporter, PST family
MTAHLAALSANPALRETAALYIVHVATYFLPLAVIPYAARVLGPEAWGLLAFFQSLALYGSMLIEYGFGLSGTRELARHRGDAPARARILAGVTAAKLLLAAACALLLSGFCLAHAHPGLAAAAVFFALGQGASCVWYLQGVGQTGRIAKAELLFRSFAVILIFALLRRPEQAWLLLAVNGAAAWASALYALRVIARDTAILRPTLAAAIETLRLGLSLFFFRSAVSLYTLANAFLLGLFVSPLLVGYYAGAERIAKGFLGLMQPLGQSLYAQLNQRLHPPGAAPSRCWLGISRCSAAPALSAVP